MSCGPARRADAAGESASPEERPRRTTAQWRTRHGGPQQQPRILLAPRTLSPIVNQTEIRVVGMSRSGNHAIIEWILAQASGRTCLHNCAEPGHNPYLRARPLSPHEPGHRATFTLDIERERAGDFEHKDYLLRSYEDVFLGAFRKPEHKVARGHWVGPAH